MKIAVIGAGFSGLAVTWHLLNGSNLLKIDLFDEKNIGEGTSGSSTGLIDPYPGKEANKSIDADIALKSAKDLIAQAQGYSDKPIIQSVGIFKPALTDAQKNEYLSRCSNFANLQWMKLHNLEGFFIPQAIAIHPKRYLKALLKGCIKKGVRFFQKKMQLSDLSFYDKIIFAGGYKVDFLRTIVDLPLKATKGQMLVCEKCELEMTICGNGHICLVDDFSYLGSTYEREFIDEQSDLTKAIHLKDQITSFFPAAKTLKVIQCRSGVRIKRKNHYLPIIDNIENNLWIITAMGSRGLLYHSYLGEKLSHAVLYNEEIDSRYLSKT